MTDTTETQDLHQEDAIKKMKEMIEDINICMFITHGENHELDMRPMSTQKVDDNGDIWFFSLKNSNKNHEIGKTHHVHLAYAKNSDSHYVTVTGPAVISQDRAKIDELRSDIAKARFPEGKDDPELTLIKVSPENGYYWDTKHGKLISLLKIAVSVVTGKPMDDSVMGELHP